MGVFNGKRADIGIAEETSRGTAETSASYWLPRSELSYDDQVEKIEDPNSVGVIEDIAEYETFKKYAEGSVTGAVEIDSIGLLLKAAAGSVSTTADTPETGVHTHEFSVQQSSQHPALTVFVQDPVQGYSYANAMLDSFSITADQGQYAQFSASLRSLPGSTGSFSPSYSAATRFRPQHITLEMASDVSSLDDSDFVTVKNVELSSEKSLEDDDGLGQLSPYDFYNAQFQCSGSLELTFKDETFKTEMLNDTAKALRLRMVNDGVTIGSSTNPELAVDLNAVKFENFERSFDNGSYVTASVDFRATYKLSEGNMANFKLINEVSSY